VPAFVRARLAAIEARGLLRDPPVIDTEDGVHGRVRGRAVRIFCSNDYLGLRQDARVRQAAADAALAYGAGSGSSRLIAGSLPIHAALESDLAAHFGTEAALVFGSGYQANLAVVAGLCVRGDLVASDRLNHASLIDGCRLAAADVVRVAHGDVAAMRRALATDVRGERFLLGEGLYSMDGDRAPLAGWAAVADEAGAHMLIDEAHAAGVLGVAGRGACAEAGVIPFVRVGTFGKAYGAHGAFVVCDSDTRALLQNVGRTYVFTTALPPAAAGAARAGLRIAASAEGDERRARLLRHAERLVAAAGSMGFDLAGVDVSAPGPIVPIRFGDVSRTMQIAARLLGAGIFATPIRPPTVPEGGARVRFTVSAAHEDHDIDALIEALRGL
jgi:8-amino-7-oxononanoate synthase